MCVGMGVVIGMGWDGMGVIMIMYSYLLVLLFVLLVWISNVDNER